MTSKRLGILPGVALVGALALAGCGSDNNAAAGSSAAATGNAGGAVAATDCPTGTLNAEGSSAQKNAIEQAIATFQDACQGASINYNPTGSGAGIKQFIAGQVDFAGSDSPLKTVPVDGTVEAKAAAKRCGSPAWDIPMVTGPIAISYNLPGVASLVLTPQVAAQIFNGRVTKWNDPAIARVNPGVSLPDTKITVFYRADESGTTENFTKYLHTAAPKAWPAAPAKSWTGKGEGKNASAGVASAVQSTQGGITYAEWSYAKDNKLSVVRVDNGAGPVTLTAQSVGKAVSAATQAGTGHDLSLNLDYATKQKGAYPILLVTYEIVCSKNQDPAKAKFIKTFLKHFSSAQTQHSLVDIGYAPLPEQVRTKVSAAIDAIS